MKNRYNLAIFDLDGTLVDLELEAFLEQAVAVIAHLGYPHVTAAQLREYARLNNFYAFVPEDERQDFRHDFHEHFDESRLPVPRPFDFAIDTLDRLATSGVTLSIATARISLPHEIEHVLRDTGLLKYISIITSRGRQFRDWRDKRDQILEICRLTAIEPGRAFMAGDSPVDITSAHNAGTGMAIALLSGAFDEDTLSEFKPTLILPDVSHIAERYR